MNTAIFLYVVQKKEFLLTIPRFLSKRTTGSMTKPNARVMGAKLLCYLVLPKTL